MNAFLFFDFSFREGERLCARIAIFYDYGLVSVELMAAGGHVLPLSVPLLERHVNFQNGAGTFRFSL